MWFQAVRGHERAKEVLARAIERGRVPPALLITGRQGSGRALLARELAKAIDCRGSGHGAGAAGPRPCNACSVCRRIDARTFPDHVVVAPEEGKAALGIDAVRAALDDLALAPVEGPRRVFVLDPADAMTEDAQNALLKALEEPPARAHLVLIATHAEALLPTIGSRCFVLALGELAPEDVRAILLARGVPAAEAEERAAWSGGSPGVALSEDHLERIAAARNVLEALADGRARKDPLGVASDLVSRVAPKNAEAPARREGAIAACGLVARALRDALAQATGDGQVRLSGAAPALVARLAVAGPDALARALGAVQRTEEAIDANQNASLALEGLVLELSGALEAGLVLRS